MMGLASTRAPSEIGCAGSGVELTGTAARGGRVRPRSRYRDQHRVVGTTGAPRRAGHGRRECSRPAVRVGVPGPGAAAGGEQCSGRRRCQPPWRRRSRRGLVRLFAPHQCPAPASSKRSPMGCRARSDGRRPRHARRVGHRGPPRRSQCCAADAARRSARLSTPCRSDLAASGRQASTALAATGRDDGAAGTGAHAQPEAVGLRAPAVVRLEGALAHVRLSVVLPLGEDRRGRVWSEVVPVSGRVTIRVVS